MANPNIPAYELIIRTEDEHWTFEHELDLHVELVNYPDATPSKVSFKAIVDPCVVTSYEPPSDIELEYVIGEETMYFEFNFA